MIVTVDAKREFLPLEQIWTQINPTQEEYKVKGRLIKVAERFMAQHHT